MMAWSEIHCRNPRCDVAGGRVLYSEKPGLHSIRRRGTGGVWAGGTPLLLVCRCGWRWRNETVADTLAAFDGLGDDDGELTAP